jgi:hypothetical protein
MVVLGLVGPELLLFEQLILDDQRQVPRFLFFHPGRLDGWGWCRSIDRSTMRI